MPPSPGPPERLTNHFFARGITQPPGNTAYNVSKSAVKSLAEGLAHSLIPTSVSAHLLVPGYTYTKLTTGGEIPSLASKPESAWTSDQVAEELFARLSEFYIICPDVGRPYFFSVGVRKLTPCGP